VASVGGDRLRADLGLDGRPVVLLATNVLGDSLTLGRNIFTTSMAEWIEKTVQYFAGRPDAQLVVRIHPGERLMKGPSMLGVIERAVQDRPQHLHVIRADEKINTYDLMEIASLGLAYTTTVGMEMAMRGVPVIVAGQTHYRGRGFTHEPLTYDEYYGMLENLLAGSPVGRLSEKQVESPPGTMLIASSLTSPSISPGG
jgi:capsule polysaccharide export protein KpsC/LpsZ